MEALTPSIQQLFEAAFLQDGARGARPDPSQWVAALGEIESKLRQCLLIPSHYYISSLPACPWCAIEARSGTSLYPVVFVAGAGGADGFTLLWQQVEIIHLPGPRPPMPDVPKATASPEAKAVGRRMRVIWLILAAALVGGWTGLWQLSQASWQPDAMFAWPFILATVLFMVCDRSSRDFRRKVRIRAAELNVLREEWLASNPRAPAILRVELDRIKKEYDSLQASRAARLRKLHENQKASQLNEYLDRFQIARAKIKGVGPAKAATLQSYSTETAADVEFLTIIAVPGFGPKTAQNLVAWRTRLERSFKFDPKRGVPPSEIARVENSLGLQRRQLEQRLKVGLEDLRASITDERATRERLQDKFRIVSEAYGQALADRTVVRVFGMM